MEGEHNSCPINTDQDTEFPVEYEHKAVLHRTISSSSSSENLLDLQYFPKPLKMENEPEMKPKSEEVVRPDAGKSAKDAAKREELDAIREEWRKTRSYDSKKHVPGKVDYEADYYAVLELPNTWKATMSEIKKNYKKLMVKAHPDKNVTVENYDDQHSKDIQDAYEVLSNRDKRIAYDSGLDFDDSIPSALDCAKIESFEDFKEIFGPVFERNEKWSLDPIIPNLGDEDTDEEHLIEFYDFWYDYKSWRSFAKFDEHNAEESENKQERWVMQMKLALEGRWMQVENERQRKKRKKKELGRIRKLVDLAYVQDPRIKEMLRLREEAKKMAEEEKQKQKELEKKKREEELAEKQKEETRLAELEVRRKEEEKAKRKRERKLMSRERSKLRKRLEVIENEEKPSETLLDETLLQLDIDTLRKLNNEEVTPESELVAAMNNFVKKEEKVEVVDAKKEEQEKEPAVEEMGETQQPERKKEEWSVEDIDILVKISKKFPVGTHDRWNKIHDFLPNRTPKEIATKSKEMRAKDASFLEQIEMKKNSRTGKRDKTVVEAAPSVNYMAIEKEIAEENKVSKSETEKKIDKKKSALGGWTPTEIRLLQVGLKKYTTKEAGRWELISSLVGTKTAEECQTQFQVIRKQLLKRKEELAQKRNN